MRPVRLQDLRPDTAAKLERIELVAALLERDASFNRSGFTSAMPSRRRVPRYNPWANVWPLLKPVFRRLFKGARAAVVTLRSPAARTSVHWVANGIVELTLGLGVAFWAVAASLIAILVLAPPG